MGSTGRGGPSASPLLVRAVELTEDREWHDYNEVIRELGKLIPPGRAIRRAERARLIGGGPPQRTKYGETERVIETGKNAIARDHLIKTWFEVKPPGRHMPGDEPRQIRMTHFPPRVKRDRELVELGRLIQPEVAIPLLLAGADARENLRGLTSEQLLRLIEAMVVKMKDLEESETRWVKWSKDVALAVDAHNARVREKGGQ